MDRTHVEVERVGQTHVQEDHERPDHQEGRALQSRGIPLLRLCHHQGEMEIVTRTRLQEDHERHDHQK